MSKKITTRLGLVASILTAWLGASPLELGTVAHAARGVRSGRKSPQRRSTSRAVRLNRDRGLDARFGRKLFENTRGASATDAKDKAPRVKTEADKVRERELAQRLSTLARTLGRDFDMRLEPGSWWAYHFDENKITYPIDDMLAHNDQYNLGVICHELSHRRYSRLPAGDEIQNKSFHYLWNAMEDIRVNKIISERYAGVPALMKELYSDLLADKKEEKKPGEKERAMLRSSQFCMAAIHEWATGGKAYPQLKSRSAKNALDQARPHIEKATRLPKDLDLRFDDLTRKEASYEAMVSFDTIRDEIWPIYKQLVEKDMRDPEVQKQLKERNEKTGKQGEGKQGEGKQGEGKKGEGKKGEGKQGEGKQGEGKQGEGKQGEGKQGEGKKGEGKQGQGKQGESKQSRGMQGEGKQGEGKQGEGKQGEGKQGEGKQGEGKQGEGKQGEGKQGEGKKGEGKKGEGKQGGERGKPQRGKRPQEEGEGGSQQSKDGTIKPEQIPHDPLTGHGDNKSLDETKKALSDLFEQAAKELGSKIEEAERRDKSARKGRGAEQGDDGVGGREQTLDYEGDTNQSLDDQIRALEEMLKSQKKDRATQGSYDEIRRRYRREIDIMVAEVDNALQRDALPELSGNYRSGVYNLRRAIQSELRRRATGRRDPKIFRRRDEPQERRSELIFVIDISGSMSGPRITAAREAYVVFQEAVSELGIKNGVIAFNSQPFVLGDLKRQESYDRENALARLKASGGNNEPGALKLARDMFDGSDADNKVVLFLTDGGAVADCKSYVERTEKETDIKVIGIGIGEGCAQVPSIYKRHLVVPNISTLPREVGELLADVVTGNE